MANFKMGDKVVLISDNSIEGAVIWNLSESKRNKVYSLYQECKFKFCLSQMDLEGEWPEKA